VTAVTDWPVRLRGVTESIVTTLGPNNRYNAAALGIHAPDREGSTKSGPAVGTATTTAGEPSTHARARTWGRTRTRRNFEARGEGYVQFLRDPVVFVDAALGIHEVDDPVLDSAAAWVRVETERTGAGREGGTEWVDWRLVPVECEVRRRTVPAFDRGGVAVVEATVAASRLDVDAYDTGELLDRLAYFETVVDRCGGPAEQTAMERFHELVDVEAYE
jgi:Uncharacterized conserved protein